MSIIGLLILLLDLYMWVIIFTVIVSWMVAFGVLNTRNRYVGKFCTFLSMLSEPVFSRLRRVVPSFGGIDISPILVILGITLLQNFLMRLY